MATPTVFSQVLSLGHHETFHRCVERYRGDACIKSFTCYDQWLAMAFAQLTARESLRDLEASLSARRSLLYQTGFRGRVVRSTLSDANERIDWRIYPDWAQTLIKRARKLYAAEPFALELDQTVYALDATVIDLCLSLFPWAHFRSAKAAIKLHTLLDLRGSIPTFVTLTESAVHEVNILDELPLEAGAIYVMERGYLDFARLGRFNQMGAFFVIRGKNQLEVLRGRKPSGRPCLRSAVRSDDSTPRLLFQARLSPVPASRPLLRRRAFSLARFPHQSLWPVRHSSVRGLSRTLADRTVFQMDQGTSQDSLLRRHHRERGAYPNLDCAQHLPARRHLEKDPQTETQSA